MKFDARPALPLLNKPAAFLSFLPIACCSSCDVLKPANDGTGISACPASWFVGRVNGGFMMTRSQDLSSIVNGVFTAAVRFRAAHGLARGEQGVGVLGIEEVERADVRPTAVDTVGHRVDFGLPVGQRGVGAGTALSR